MESLISVFADDFWALVASLQEIINNEKATTASSVNFKECFNMLLILAFTIKIR